VHCVATLLGRSDGRKSLEITGLNAVNNVYSGMQPCTACCEARKNDELDTEKVLLQHAMKA
jgi:hypothetical protein